jgi:hypothetical protein
MTTETYSVAKTARRAELRGSIASITLPDSAATVGAQMQRAQSGLAFMCKMPDGSLQLARIVPELSNFSTGDIVVQVV